jgi:hypothetical protein
VRSLILAPSPALGITVTFGLYAVTPGASATLGNLVTGSSAAVDATSATNIFLETDSGDFTFSADGIYALGYTVSGTPSNNANVYASLQLRNV